MPYIPDSPATESVLVPADKAISVFSIDSIVIQLSQSSPLATTMHVVWFEGFMDENGAFVPAKRKEADLAGPAFLTAMNSLVTPGLSHYNDFRAAIWTLMATQGLIPVGDVS